MVVMLLSGAVLGISANFANKFDASSQDGFIIFSLVVTALQIFIFLLSLQWSQPRFEMVILFFFGVLWLAMGAWSTDLIGHVQCSRLSGRISGKGDSTFSEKSFCQQMKVIQAFSWTIFGLFVIAFIILNQLVNLAKRWGRHHIMKESIKELPWFDEQPGYYNQHTGGPQVAQFPPGQYAPGQYGAYPGGYGYPAPMSPGAAQGHSVIIQPGINGAPPTITQV